MRVWTLLAILLVLTAGCQANAEAVNKQIPKPMVDTPAAEATGNQVAVFAGGCFWGIQGMFQHVRGVVKVVAGYSGGIRETALY